MIGKKINELATKLDPLSSDLTIIGDPSTGVSKKVTLGQIASIFSGAIVFVNNYASLPVTGTTDIIYCLRDSYKIYIWNGGSYVETLQILSQKGAVNGYASLDSLGKVPISQLPSSIMEYKGMWNASTNTPTLANGTGDTGDVYICNVAGSVNFGAGVISFAVGDYVIYSGSIWQRSSGAVGTVTSVAITESGDSLNITGSPITTSGTINIGFNGTNLQYVNGAGNLTTFPILTGYVPYTGATGAVNLGAYDLAVNTITVGKGGGAMATNTAVGYQAGAGANSGVGQGTFFGYQAGNANTTGAYNVFLGYKSGFLNTTGYGNVVVGNLSLSSNVVGYGNTAIGQSALQSNTGNYNTAIGQSALQSNTSAASNTSIGVFSLTNNTGANNTSIGATSLYSNTTGNNNTSIGHYSLFNNTTGAANTAIGRFAGTYISGGVTANTITNNSIFLGYDTRALADNQTNQIVIGYNETGLGSNTTILGNSSTVTTAVRGNLLLGTTTESGLYKLDVNGTSNIVGQLKLGSTITNGTYTYTLPSATGTLALVGGSGVGTVTSVAALTIGTNGTDVSSSVANSTTTPVITLNVPTASATNRGALSSADWTTFNSKQSTITLTTTGTSGVATFSANTLNIPNYGSALSGYLPLTGGTLTGPLNGTSAVFTGALNGTSASFSSTVQLAGNGIKLNWFSSGYENWYAGTITSTTQWSIGSASQANILTLGNSGAATFSSTLNVGGVTDIQSARTAQLTLLKLSTTTLSTGNNDEISIDFGRGGMSKYSGRISGYIADYTTYDGGLKFYSSTSGTLNATPSLTIASTGAATFSGALSGTSATFSSSLYVSSTATIAYSGLSGDFGAGYTIGMGVGYSSSVYKGINMGWNTTLDMGFIGPVHNGQAWKSLILCPIGGGVYIGATGNNSIYAGAATFSSSIISSATAAIQFKNSTSLRWELDRDGTETGSNAGSNLTLYRYDDAGAYLGTSLTLIRSTGAATFSSSVTATSAFIQSANTNSVVDIFTLSNPSVISSGVRQKFANGYGDLAAIKVSQIDNGAGADNGKIELQTATDAILSTKLTILDNGAATFSSTLGINGISDNVKSGTYTPTIGYITNAASSTAYTCQYMRVGNTVTVSGIVAVTATTLGTNTRISMTLPVSSSFDYSYRAGGGGGARGTTIVSVVSAGASTSTVLMDFTPLTTSMYDYYFSYTYLIM